ncbi:hypothetical protein GUITHDRAFT_106561 [Guillardia theta CCMP2712]|uniref:Uncharacterized protein n=1 Tax=Guillardia theta (strain CCMP2712) TaxID=905079 RepID=L1JGC7_GUITC|nr:hypothetical protein GUITHDRAFT_106561 [Guillardia theta CCMP2712]EKX47573.1 hypothetical protein GUITHDRAFT_106561 [Guillardia theta CCMP2712]|eukprot:XP_005834553.1 hypothetical protein GUITHDRAFT_106561 [Guillardia theta CCMP2712]
MAEGYEQNRDLVEALCCYKSALTWNKDDETNLLPDDYKKKAADRLALVAKELKFSQDWQSDDRKTKDLRPASILKLIQSKVHAKEAVQAYLRCEDFRMSTNAKFHLDFGTACKEYPEHRDVAMQALEIASEDSDMEAAARHGQADIQYDRHQYDAAEQLYARAYEKDPSNALACSGMANCEKDKGNLEEAIRLYKEAASVSPGDPTFAFNLAQAYEYVQKYEAALNTLQDFCATVKESELTTINHFAVYILFAKLVFVAGQPFWQEKLVLLLSQINNFPDVVKRALQGLTTHWAYFFFISKLMLSMENCPPPETTGCKPLFLVGDSHVLSGAWGRIKLKKTSHYIFPKLVTGLKAWHLREGHQFLTVANLHECMKSLPADAKEIVFVCGEIDCREGIPGAVMKRKYESMQKAVEETVQIFDKAVKYLSKRFSVKMFVLSVCPPSNPQHKDRIEATNLFNKKLKEVYGPKGTYIDISNDVTTSEGVLKSDFVCDGTHMNRGILKVLEKQFNSCLKTSSD